MKQESRLFAGPFVGEFGHELFCWQGVLRNNSKKYDDVTIVCTPGKEVLYEDFANKIITYTPETYEANGPYNYGKTENYPIPDYECDYIGPNTQLTEYHGSRGGHFEPNLKQEFVKLGAPCSSSFKYIIHARATSKVSTGYRNWSVDKWDRLVESLDGSVACIGTVQGAYHIQGTEDLRDLPLSELCNILSTSEIIIGPSSGPMHLASLCGLKQVVWSGDWYNKKRYEQDWNPHNTDVSYLNPNTWDIKVEEVLQCLK